MKKHPVDLLARAKTGAMAAMLELVKNRDSPSVEAELKSATEADLVNLRQMALDHWTMKSWAAWHYRFFVGALLGPIFSFLLFGTPAPEGTPLAPALLAYFACAGITGLVGGVLVVSIPSIIGEMFGSEGPDRLVDVLEPLNEVTGNCRRALQVINESPLAAAYREAVLRNNRQLRKIDLSVMNRLASDDYSLRRQAKNKEECLQLHGAIPFTVAG